MLVNISVFVLMLKNKYTFILTKPLVSCVKILKEVLYYYSIQTTN